LIGKGAWALEGGKPVGRGYLELTAQRLRARAGLKDARIRVRCGGRRARGFGKLLGHTVTTTARYTPPAADSVKAAADQVAQSIASAPFVLNCYPAIVSGGIDRPTLARQ
jgi:hypothetical protein